MTLTEIAEQIHNHLKRFESSSKHNPVDKTYHTRPFFHSHAYRAGRFVSVQYVSYQGSSSLTKKQAIDYLYWLDAGNVGTHYRLY